MDRTLPQRLYLLSFDPEKNRLDAASTLVRGPSLRAAALAELTLQGLLQDEKGKAVRNTAAAAPADPFLAEVLELASPDERTHWFTLVDRGWHKAESTVRDGLEALGDISSTRRKVLGVFPSRQVRLTEPARLSGLRENVRDAVLLDRDPASVPVQDAILAALAADADVYSVFTVKERWRHRKAFAGLGKYVDGVLPGLRTATVAAMSARRSSAPVST